MIIQESRDGLPMFLKDLIQRFSVSIALQEPGRERHWHLEVDKKDAHRIAECLVQTYGARFATLVGTDERAFGRHYGLFQIFDLGREGYLTLESRLDDHHLGFASITPVVPAANWAEREVQDLLGFHPVGHPDPRPLILPEGWPKGHYPLRKDFDPIAAHGIMPAAMDLMRVAGEGVHEVAVGPVHAGIIEPGHFRFSVDGEHVINLEARLFWKHRGMEKRAEGTSFAEGLLVAERICGACSFANGLAYAQAVEVLTRCQVPARAAFIRVIGAELERLYNHAGDIGGVLTDVAYSAGAAQAMRLRERLLDLNEELAGNRLLMGLLAVGGVKNDIEPGLRRRLERELPGLRRDMAAIMNILLHSESVLDRLETTGIVSPGVAADLGLVGPVARATGVDLDVRRDHPYAAYEKLSFEVPTRARGDVLSRVKVKAEEFSQSVGLIEQALALMPGTPLRATPGEARPGSWAFEATESARGENLHFVMAGENDTVFRHKVRTSSYMNWPAMQLAALGNILPDFPVINKSFNLCYACCDR